MNQRISTSLAVGFCALLLFAEVGFAQQGSRWHYAKYGGKLVGTESSPILIFKSTANFWRATFDDEANFTGAKFESKAFFFFSTFDGQANFGQSRFGATVGFTNTDFRQGVDFRQTYFDSVQTLYLENIKFPDLTWWLLFKPMKHFQDCFGAPDKRNGSNLNKTTIVTLLCSFWRRAVLTRTTQALSFL